MENAEPLLTVAEVAVAFVGFASLVTVVARRGIETWAEGNMVRFRLMISMSLSSIFFALLPFAFLAFEWKEERSWLICSLSLGIYLAVTLSTSTRGYIALAKQGQLNPFVVGSLSLVVLGATILQLAGVLGAVQPSLGTYLVGVLSLLLLSAVSFARLVSNVILPRS